MHADPNPQNASRRALIAGALGAAALGVASFRAVAAAQGLTTLTRAGMAFQTSVALTLAGSDLPTLETAMEAAFVALRAVETASSVYRFDSEVSRLNRTGRLDRPSRHLLTLLRYASALSRDTNGAYDVTVQPLWDLWAACAARHERPSATALRDTVANVDWRGVDVTEDRVILARAGMAVTLNSINQGYAADVVMDTLVEHGVAHAFVDTGEFGARGMHPDRRPWRLGIVAPRDVANLAVVLDPFRGFSATSGDYETFFSPDFADNHIVDPRVGTSPQAWSQITVRAPSGLEADGLATALFVVGEADAERLLRQRQGCSAIFFDKAGKQARPVA